MAVGRLSCPTAFATEPFNEWYDGISSNQSRVMEVWHMTYIQAIICTLAAWFVGLFADANIDFGDPQGFLALRVLFPILAMGICILKAIKNNEKK